MAIPDHSAKINGFLVSELAKDSMDHCENSKVKSESSLHTILNNIRLPGVILNLNGNIIFCNDFLLDLTGRKREDVLGKSWFDIFLPAEIISEIKTIFLKTIETADLPSYYENEIITRDGNRRAISWNNTVFKDKSGKISGITSIGEDITDRRFAEKSLLNSKGQLRTLIDTIPDLVWLKDKNGVFLTCNSKFERLYGAKEAQIVGKTDYDFVEKDLADFFTLNDWKAIEAGKPTMNEEELTYSDDGHKEYVETIKSPMYDSNGHLIGVLGVGRDITRRKLDEEELQRREMQLRTAQKVGGFGSWELDLNSGKVDASEEAIRIYGLEGKQLTIESIQKVPLPEYRSTLDTALRDLVGQKSPYGVQFRIMRQNDGEIRYIHSVAEYFADRHVIIGTIHDITELKQAEDMLLHAKLAAEDANKSKGEFLSTISHELRTPLNSIIGFSDMLLSGTAGSLNKKQAKYINHISTGGKHLLAVINDILDLAKIDAGKMELYYESFSVSDAIEEVKMLVAPLAFKKNIDLDIKVEPQIGSINADKIKFKQILYNLASNAIKFTHEKGYVCITAHLIDNMLEISVTDNGIGISTKDLHKLFQPFKQLSSYMTREHEGTGLGLVLVKKYVEMHSGSVWVESEVGKGSIFTFTIPYC